MAAFVALVLLVVLAGVGWFVYNYSEVERDLALEKLARRSGMNFRFGLPQELKDVLPRFRIMEDAREKGGEFQAGINSITGTLRGRKVAFFDFQWVTVFYTVRRRSVWLGWGNEEYSQYRTHRRSAVAVELGVGVQPVLIRPERLVDKALALAGYEDIDFSSLPEFSDRFYVNSPDRFAAARLVTPAVARFCREERSCTADFVGPWLLLHPNGMIRASQVEAMLDTASRLADLVTREQSGGAGPP